MFLIRLKYFHNCRNTEVILATRREFVSAKCAQFPLTINGIKLKDEHYFQNCYHWLWK